MAAWVQLYTVGPAPDDDRIDYPRGVKAIQRVLNALEYPHLRRDGIYGEDTANVVAEFQEDEGLVVDGVVGSHTAGALYDCYLDTFALPPMVRAWMPRGITLQESSGDPGARGSVHPPDSGWEQINLDAPPPDLPDPVSRDDAFDPPFCVGALIFVLGVRTSRYREKYPHLARHDVRDAAVVAWHAPAWGDQWAALGHAPNPDAQEYVDKVRDKGKL